MTSPASWRTPYQLISISSSSYFERSSNKSPGTAVDRFPLIDTRNDVGKKRLCPFAVIFGGDVGTVGMGVEDSDQTQPEAVGFQFGFEIILRREQEPIVPRSILTRI